MRFLQINWSAEPPQFSRRSFFIRVLVGHIAFLLCWFGYWQIEENNWLQRWPEGVGAAFLGMIIALTWEHRRNRRKSHASIQSQAIQTPEIRKNAWNALAKITPAVIRCRICAQPLTRPLSYLSDSSLLNTTDNEPFIPSGFYAASDDKLVEVTDVSMGAVDFMDVMVLILFASMATR